MNRTGIGLLLIALMAGACSGGEERPYVGVHRSEDVADHVAADLYALQEELGIQSSHVNFGLRAGTRLEARFRAELDGQVIPELSPTFYIPASESGKLNEGTIAIRFWEQRRGRAGAPVWSLEVNAPGGHVYNHEEAFPYYWVEGSGGGGGAGGTLSPETEMVPWSYSRTGKTQTGEVHELDYTLTVRVLDLEPGQPADRIEVREFPQAAVATPR